LNFFKAAVTKLRTPTNLIPELTTGKKNVENVAVPLPQGDFLTLTIKPDDGNLKGPPIRILSPRL
jgi:hypothetical protein